MLLNKFMVILVIFALISSSLLIAGHASTGSDVEPVAETNDDDKSIEPLTEPSTRGPSSRATTLDFTDNSTGLPSSGDYNFVSVGDFNYDGAIDFASGGEDYSTSTQGLKAYTGNNGTSWTDTSTNLWTGNSWGGVQLADADEDGFMELYAADERWGTSNGTGLEVWEYRGSSWTRNPSHVRSPLPTGRCDNVLLMNITGDSRLDLVVSNYTGLKYFENQGGNPVTWRDRSTGLPTGGEFTAAFAADMNKDGLLDLVATTYSGTGQYMYIQKTSGNLWQNYNSGLQVNVTSYGIAVGDVNNDGHNDVVWGAHGSGLRTKLGNSGGGSGGTSFSWQNANTNLPTSQRYSQIQLGDIDLDGDLDLLAPVGTGSNGIEIYLGDGSDNPGWNFVWTKATTKNITTSGNWYGTNLYDVNHDGSLDIIASSWGSGFRCYLNKLTGNFDKDLPGAVTLTHTNTTTNSITVNWTAPADNGTNASSGLVQEYDLRYSTSTINIGNWATATQVTGEPAPASSGTPQGHQITGLSPATTYYMVLRSRDERPNWSPLSNVLVNTTLSIVDINPPGQVTDLRTENPTNNSIILKWTAPANNGTDLGSGPVISYDIRYYSASVTNGTWPSAAVVPSPPTPGAPGTTETFNVTGLAANTTYYFALKARDGKPNWNFISNSPWNKTLPDPDITPPMAIVDLTASNPTTTTVNLTWTATGDDGNLGQASFYDIRYSSATITDGNWASATQAIGEPVPQWSAASESFQVPGLSSDTTYYFALKAADENQFWSPLSNIASAKTLPLPDTTPPSAITDLSTDMPTVNSLRVKWTAPGDDGSTGMVAGYNIRYSSVSITDANWASATMVSGSPTPVAPGNAQLHTVNGLVSNTTYFFAVKSFDEVPNLSPISNSAVGTTLASTDIVAPDPITDLGAQTVSSSSVNLTWTAPGDDGDVGQATGYDIRYAAATITDVNWASAAEVANEPQPASGGSSEFFVVNGLFADTTYYFAIKTFDEKPNYSPLSNIASAKTQASADTAVPARINDLAVDGTTASTAALSWTAVGDDGGTGTATAYDLRYAEVSITDGNWNVAFRVTGLSTPKSAGLAESFQVTGLDPDTTYFFAIKAADEVPNWSPLSNIASGKTTGIAKPFMVVEFTQEKTWLYSNENMSLTVKALDKIGLLPIDGASVQMSADDSGLKFEPVTGDTNFNGELTLLVTAPEVLADTEIIIFADVTMTEYKSNRSFTKILVKPIPPDAKFNLKVTEADITLNKTDMTEGDVVKISALISNTGDTFSSSFIIRFYVNGTQVGGDQSISILKIGESITIETTWTAVAGAQTIKVELIPSNPVKESDATDNSAEKSITVKKKDVVIVEPPVTKKDDEKEGFLSTPFLIVLIVVIIVIVVVFAMVMMRKRKREMPPSQLPPPPPPSYPGAPVYDQYGQVLPPPAEGVPPPPPEGWAEQPQVAWGQAEGIGIPLDEASTTAGEPAEETGEPPSGEMGDEMEEVESSLGEALEGTGEATAPSGETEGEVPPAPEQPVSPEQPAEQPPAEQQQEQAPAVQMVPCPTCGNQIAAYATPCPHCNTTLNWG